MARRSSISPVLQLAVIGAGLYFGRKLWLDKLAIHAGTTAANLKMRIESVHTGTEGVTIDIGILNPNTMALRIQSFVGNLLVNGVKVGDIQMFGDYNVKGNAQMSIPLVVRVLKNVYPQQARTWQQGQARVQFNGTINVNDRPIPITLGYTV